MSLHIHDIALIPDPFACSIHVGLQITLAVTTKQTTAFLIKKNRSKDARSDERNEAALYALPLVL